MSMVERSELEERLRQLPPAVRPHPLAPEYVLWCELMRDAALAEAETK